MQDQKQMHLHRLVSPYTHHTLTLIALGAGTELTSNYKNIKLVYLGIENIHAVRDSLIKLHGLWIESTTTNTSISSNAIEKTGWTRHLKTIMAGAKLLISAMHIENRHVIIHCRYTVNQYIFIQVMDGIGLHSYHL